MDTVDVKKLRKQKRLAASRQQQTKTRDAHKALGRKVVNIWVDADLYALIQKARVQHGFPNVREATYACVKRGIEMLMPDEYLTAV